MTATAPRLRPARLTRARAEELARALRDDFGRRPGGGVLRHQVMLDALARGELRRFTLWAPERVGGALFAGGSGSLVPAGLPDVGPALAEVAERISWRVLVGDAALCTEVVDHAGRGLFRRRPRMRQQRLMIATARSLPAPGAPPPGARPAVRGDLEPLVEMACRLHVEDRMGPPIAAGMRGPVRARMRDSIDAGRTWVVAAGAELVAKVDLSVLSSEVGAQIAGVYVRRHARGRGVGTALVRHVARAAAAEVGVGVTLHVRADNAGAIATYERAGLVDVAAWVLALR